MYALGSWHVPSDEIRLYANDMQRSYTEYGIETRIELPEANGIYSFCWYLTCAEYEFETFGATSDRMRLMAFCLNADNIDVSLQTWLSISDEIGIITNDFKLTRTDN